jgi:RNA polymerase primary sigma factor
MKKSSRHYDNEILSMYLKDINRINLLTREEENTLARKAVKGDKTAQNKLIQANLRFVVNVAKKYQNQGLPLDDLISEGNIGLMNAIRKYDPDKGYHFISYAVWWIRQAILKAICEKSRMIRLPLNRANELVQIQKTQKQLMSQHGMEPDDGDIARSLNMKEKDVTDLINISRDMVSLETPVFSEKDSANIGDFIEDTQNQGPDDTVISHTLKEDINQALQTLTDKEAKIIEYRFGLNNQKPMSLKEIGDKYKLTKERIRQIEKKAIKRLQHPARKQYLEAYIA